MAMKQIWRGLAVALLLALTAGALPARAETTAAQAPAQTNFRGAIFVQSMLGEVDQESGLHRIDGQPDGQTRYVTETGGRQSVAAAGGADRFFYFDVHDTYINGGHNKVRMTVTYRDVGLTPIYMEYDSFDPVRPNSRVDEVIRRRVVVATRGNTEGWKTAFIDLEDARFANAQPGGADFRIGSSDDLTISSVSVRLVEHKEPVIVHVTLNGKEIVFDPEEAQPFVHPQTSRTLVPFRAMFNALGVPNDDIIWHNDTRTVEARKGQTIVMLPIDKPVATVDGRQVVLDQPATVVGGRTVVPLRFVSEVLGLDVQWVEATKTVVLTTKAQPLVPPTTTPVEPPATGTTTQQKP